MNEIFRFTALRAPQRRSKRSGQTPQIAAYPHKLSPFAEELAKLSPKDAATRAQAFIVGPAYVTRLDVLESPLGQLDLALLSPSALVDIDLAAVVETVFGMPAAKVLSSGEYRTAQARLADSLLAVVSMLQVSAPGQACLIRGLRLCAMLEEFAVSGSATAAKAMLKAMVVLPRRDVPATMPQEPNGSTSTDVAQRAQFVALRQTSIELKRLQQRKQMSIAARGLNSDERVKLPSSDRLSKSELAMLSDATKTVMQNLSLPEDNLFLPAAIEHIDLYLNFELANWTWLTPFYFPTTASVPVTIGRARVAGISDLLFVRQRVKRYEAGEIAHIENALRGESFARVFKRKDMSETIDFEETEKSEAIERDLQSTNKSELKSEVARTIEEDFRFEAGVNVTATGPGIEVGANLGFAYDRATEESTKASTTFARDVVDRSVSKISERALKRRSTRATREVEETSEHKIDNTAATDHLAGVYRWVDKIYEAQVVNYGRRLILEFVIAEPGAFYRMARAHQSPPGVMAVLPEAPTFVDTMTRQRRPLRVDDINEFNYLEWVSQYAVIGVNPPPALVTFIGTAIESGPVTAPADSVSKALATGSLKVQSGYRATEIRVDWAGEHDNEPWFWDLVVGADSFTGASGVGLSNNVRSIGETTNYDGEIPVSLVVKNIGSFTANIVVRCERSQAGLHAWKLATFNSIMSRYFRLKSDYEDQVASAQVQQGKAVFGSNPASNREIERNELRRQSIAMVTGQNFEHFDAMGVAADPLRYPQINDFAEAQAEGNYIQFFEQALQWRHMTYMFYPYFWGRKSQWTEVLNESIDDPVFAQFLRAGAARVQVPVRPGFEDAMAFFLDTGKVWFDGEPPHFEDAAEDGVPPFMPLFQELQEQSGLEFEDGPGVVQVHAGSATIVGTGTAFAGPFDEDPDANVDREIRIAGRDYRIRRVVSATELLLAAPYAGSDATELPYGLGPKLVGQPWDVKLPTQLVILQGKESALNLPDTAL